MNLSLDRPFAISSFSVCTRAFTPTYDHNKPVGGDRQPESK